MDWREVISGDNEILWEGKAESGFYPRFLPEYTLSPRLVVGPPNRFILWLVTIVFSIKMFLKRGAVPQLAIVISSLSYPFLESIYMRKKARNTWYAITSKGVYFYIWSLLKGYQLHFLDYRDIGNIGMVDSEQRNPFIFFHCIGERPFIGKDLRTGKSRHHPTIELNEPNPELFELIRSQWEPLPKSQTVTYLQSDVDPVRKARAEKMRKIYALSFLVTFVFVLDYFLLPPRAITETVVHLREQPIKSYHKTYGH